MSSLNLDPKKTSKTQWKSLEELADAPELKEFVNFEFPEGADVMDVSVSRRRFLQVMGAGMAFAGVTGCKGIRRPEVHILPYNKMPESMVPGVPQFYATTVSLAGEAVGILVEAHEGRPTKIEGNPDHPASLGATSRQHQATILDLYNPERTQVPHKGDVASTWESFWQESNPVFEALKLKGGEGLYFLSGYMSSPSSRAVRDHAAKVFPKAKWVVYEAVNRDPIWEGLYALTGKALEPLYHFDRTLRILSLDCDFLDSEPNHLNYAREFAKTRNPEKGLEGMSRLYAVESHFSVTGGSADHRLRVKPSVVPHVLIALGRELKAQGLNLDGLKIDFDAVGDRSMGHAEWIKALAADLLQHKGRSVVAVGKSQSPVVHALGHALNMALENVGATVEWRASTAHNLNATNPQAAPEKSIDALNGLGMDLDAGRVEALIILDANPAYAAPTDLAFGSKISKAKFSAHLGCEKDDTSALCGWQLPMSHYLETWSDAQSYQGTTSIVQPLISPLYESLNAAELVSKLTGYPQTSGLDIVRDYWMTRHGAVHFENQWRKWLHDGIIPGEMNASDSSFDASRLAKMVGELPASGKGIELILREHPCVGDGRFANNAWLLETPDPITKLNWDNAFLMGPKMAESLGIRSGLLNKEGTGTTPGDYNKRPMVKVTVGSRVLEAAAWVMPGMADDTLLLHLGFGRVHVGVVGEGAGFNAYVLMRGDNSLLPSVATIEKLDRIYPLACTQDHWSMENRPIVREGELEEYLQNPEEFASEEKWNEHPPENSLWAESVRGTYDFSQGMQWGMAIDLNTCTGCNACLVACQAENNIPTVGKEQVLRGREMHWIRIDRYFVGETEDPTLVFQPMACQQCENAPCEEVCPVGATVHSHEGLNDMAYNRCVGTRYCSNNCPYKVRRFNFFNYTNHYSETEKMRMNPDVTIRFRGVMEKCTYCVQRINRARIVSKNAGSETIPDGGITPACAQVCPSEAIIFGDINDPQSRVAKLKKHPRNYGVLRDINTKPRTSYLARVRNPNPALEKA